MFILYKHENIFSCEICYSGVREVIKLTSIGHTYKNILAEYPLFNISSRDPISVVNKRTPAYQQVLQCKHKHIFCHKGITSRYFIVLVTYTKTSPLSATLIIFITWQICLTLKNLWSFITLISGFIKGPMQSILQSY